MSGFSAGSGIGFTAGLPVGLLAGLLAGAPDGFPPSTRAEDAQVAGRDTTGTAPLALDPELETKGPETEGLATIPRGANEPAGPDAGERLDWLGSDRATNAAGPATGRGLDGRTDTAGPTEAGLSETGLAEAGPA